MVQTSGNKKVKIKYQQIEENGINDLKALLNIYVDVFEMGNFEMPETTHLTGLLLNNKVIFYIAIADGNVAGGLTAYILPSIYSASCEVYIYDLAIKTVFQRKGIGNNLITSFKKHCKEQGYKEVFVQAVFEDKHAIDFYKATGGIAENVVHFSYPLKENKM